MAYGLKSIEQMAKLGEKYNFIDETYVNTGMAVTARALTMGVTNDCKSMSVKLRYWIVNIIQRDTARPRVSRLCILKGSFT